jgi:hypothetical protein
MSEPPEEHLTFVRDIEYIEFQKVLNIKQFLEKS